MEKSSVELYHKLRPHLRIATLEEDAHATQAWKTGLINRRDRQPFYVRCTKDYLWGGYYAQTVWEPRGPSKRGIELGMDRPTYEQFCTWFKLELEEA